MSTITAKRRAIERSINWAAYREQRAQLADLFAVIAYSGQAKRPLALGVKADLVGANTGLSPDEIRHFLRAYTFGPKYLRCLKKGAWRHGLDGAKDGWVSPNEAEFARLSLDAHYADRERRRTVREIVVRAVEAAQRLDIVQAEQPYPYRFAREAA